MHLHLVRLAEARVMGALVVVEDDLLIQRVEVHQPTLK
jgi:hypothetical protein